MDETMAARYWCHMCSQMVNPIMESEIKCPFCQSGFIEEMSSNVNGGGGGSGVRGITRDVQDSETDFGTDRALSLWAPILLGMMSSPRRRRRFRRSEFGEDNDDDNVDDELNNVDGNDNSNLYRHHHHRARRHGGEIDLDREFESILRRRRRSSGNILQLLQGIRAGIASEYESSDENPRERDGNNNSRVIMINPYNQSLVVQGSSDQNHQNHHHHHPSLTSLGDYFIGPGLDLLLQHLAENDPNRQGTPPARKEAVEALPTVKITEPLQCSVCLDDFEKGTEAKEMPCKHKFHIRCIVPWLELHSSCPVCRFELPSSADDDDETKTDSTERPPRTRNVRDTNNRNVVESVGSGERGREDDARSGNGRRFSFPWPFSGLFSSSSSSSASSSSGTQSGENNFYSRSSGSSR
ncbi:PREDICTED: E3 ubiquitin-protein ligase RNF126-like [Camelina sativa]|uniref:RING-type E3 ubiquitin transferase n=1 Tax=Camelina sativa TaxID=90675 RepID=A0ABM0XAL3_CAMSA|nr:PREDICTED: E3 ubiquitin-protein ligase RNF126-like [Camelina sativa]